MEFFTHSPRLVQTRQDQDIQDLQYSSVDSDIHTRLDQTDSQIMQ